MHHVEEGCHGHEDCSDSEDEKRDELPSLPCDYSELELVQQARRRGK